jgi:inner membrane protein
MSHHAEVRRVYRQGHYGVSLLCWAPIGAWLAITESAVLSIIGGLVVLLLAMLPDFDYHLPLVTHRGITHTVWFALLVGSLLAVAGHAAGTHAASVPMVAPDTVLGLRPALGLSVFGGVVGVVAIGAHLVADLLTPDGIVPFWPLWRRRLTCSLFRGPNLIANYGLLALGLAATAAGTIAVVV